MDNFNLKLFNQICQEVIDKELSKKDAIEKLSDILSGYYIKEIENDFNKNDLRHNVDMFLREKEREGLRKNTLNSYKIQLDLFVDYIGDKVIQEITKDDIGDFLYHREVNFSISSKGSMETIRAVLKVFFDWLKEEDKIFDNPIRKIKPYKLPDTFVESLEVHELEKLRNSCETMRERSIIEIFVATGCLLSEITQLTQDSINWDRKVITIKAQDKRKRLILLSDRVLEILKNYQESRNDDNKYLFVTARCPIRKMSNRAIQREISIISERARIKKNISPKVLRHTFARIMLNNGYPMNVLQTLLGHKDYSNTSETCVRITNENIHKVCEEYIKNI